MTHHLLPAALPAVALFWIAALVCAIAHVAILRSVLRARHRRATEIAWAVLPAAALAVVFLMTWRTMHAGVA
jgi:heme/copper-type cytochrome/quinol oxidase subunit 2